MFCQNCGFKFEGKFCPECGSPAAMVPPSRDDLPDRNTPSRESYAGRPEGGNTNPPPNGNPPDSNTSYGNPSGGNQPYGSSADANPTYGSQSNPSNRDREYGSSSHSSSSHGSRGRRKKKKGPGFLIPIIVVLILFMSCGVLFGKSSDQKSNSTASQDAAKTETVDHNQVTQETETETDTNAGTEVNAGADVNTEAGSEAGAGTAPLQEQPQEQQSQKVVDYNVRQEYFIDYYTEYTNRHYGAGFVEIENTGNTNLYLHDAVFDIEDNSGHLLQSEDFISSCPDVILPGEIGYFYTDSMDITDIDTSNGAVFAPHYKVEEARHEVIDYEVSDLGIREDNMWKCMVSGRLTNTHDKEINIIYVNVIYYGHDGSVIGISGTNLTDIQPGDTASFEVTGQFFRDDINYSDIAQYKVIPRAWYMQF